MSYINIEPKPFRRQVKQSQKIDIHKTKLPNLREKYSSRLEEKFEHSWDPRPWEAIRNVIYDTALQTFGKKRRQNTDWYNASLSSSSWGKASSSSPLKSRPRRPATITYRASKSAAQASVQKCAQDYWDVLCSNIETAKDSRNIKAMYKAIKTTIGITTQTCGVLKRKDASTIEDKSEKLVCWIEHFSEV